MLTFLLFSLVLAAKDFESLANVYTNCTDGDGVDRQNLEHQVLFYHDKVDGCFKVTRTNNTIDAPGVWKTYHVEDPLPPTFTITPDPTTSPDPGVSNKYTAGVFNTVGYIPEVLDALYMTVARHDGAFPGKTISLMGTFYGINHIGRRVAEDTTTQRRTVEYFSKVEVPNNNDAADTEGFWMLWYAGATEFGLIDTGCVPDTFDSLPATKPTDAEYKCTTGNTSRTIDSQRFATGYHLVHVNDVENDELKTMLMKYGPLVCNFQLNTLGFLSSYYNLDGDNRPAYAIPTPGASGNCFLVYGWDTVNKSAQDTSESNPTVEVWKIKYMYPVVGPTPNTHNPFGLLKILKANPHDNPDNMVNTQQSGGAAYLVKDCTGESCDTCSAAGCVCGTSKCDKCPTGTDKTNCTCDGNMNCAVCPTPADTDCKCTALCSKCPEGSNKDDCDPDPSPPDDAAFGVKVTLLLALLAAFFAL